MSGLFVIDSKTGSTLPLCYSEDESAHTTIFRLTSQ